MTEVIESITTPETVETILQEQVKYETAANVAYGMSELGMTHYIMDRLGLKGSLMRDDVHDRVEQVYSRILNDSDDYIEYDIMY